MTTKEGVQWLLPVSDDISGMHFIQQEIEPEVVTEHWASQCLLVEVSDISEHMLVDISHVVLHEWILYISKK